MISEREVSSVRVSILNEADASDPLNQHLLVAFTATVDGKEVFARSYIRKTNSFAQDYSLAIANLVARALSGECVHAVADGPSQDTISTSLLHYDHIGE
jgi:hypothetical protein